MPVDRRIVVSRNLLNLTEEQREVVSLAQRFAADEIAPHAAEWDRDERFEPSIVGKLGALGFLGMLLPEQYDGLELSTSTYLLALEEIAAVDASTAVMMSVHNSLPTQMILRFGTEEQRRRFLPAMARGEMLGAFALSEPEAGSDAAALSTQATFDGDAWVLNGTKAWVTNGGEADVIVVLARTDSPGDRRGARGISAFLVTPDLPGFKVGRKEEKMGLRASPTVQLALEQLRVPASGLLGEQGAGFVQAMQSLDNGRLGIAAQAVGIARAALEEATAYAGERRQFGTVIREFEAIQFKLADMATRVAASRARLHATADAKDRGESVTAQASMAKLFASETAMFVTTEAIQILGGYG
jgi:alkylation response protein AidB-like acyl-CoA dehydrogenase